jgi:hypothetical protein
MPVTGKLTALKVAREKRPGLYGDGGGLYLQISKRGSKSWIFRFWLSERDPVTGELVHHPATKKIKSRCRDMGLGPCVTDAKLQFSSTGSSAGPEPRYLVYPPVTRAATTNIPNNGSAAPASVSTRRADPRDSEDFANCFL